MTTGTIMRSKQTPSTTIGRPLHTTRSHYSGGVIYPQWMRSLEEKYQRIHMKIARSTTAMSNIYNSSLGRNNIPEKHLLKASLAKPRDSFPGRFSSTQLQQRRVASSLERGVSRTRISITDLVPEETQQNSQQDTALTKQEEDTVELTNVDEVVIEETDEKINDDVIDVCVNDKEDRDSNSSVVDEDENNIGFVLEGVGDIDSSSSDDDENEKDTNDVKEFEEEQVLDSKESTLLIDRECSVLDDKNLDYKSKLSLRDSNKLSPVKGEPRKHFITQLGKRYQHSPNGYNRREQVPRTSTSRRSIQTHKTSKSCPATMEHTAPQPQTERATHIRSKSSKKSSKGPRHSNMFSRMSMEAQHARTEILKEKKPLTSKKQHQQQQKQNNRKLSGCDGVSSSSKEEENEQKQTEVVRQINEKKTSEVKSVGRLCNGEDYNKMFTEMNVIADYEQAFSDSEISNANRKHAFTVLSNRTKLPNIADGKYVTLQHLKTLQYTLPGIGRYSVAPKRETTFEITPPGFDIRYKDMMVLEERESETPPPDIRNRAVQKCQEWLARHTPR